MCASCLCTRDGWVAQNACARARALCAVLSHRLVIQASMESNFFCFLTLSNICQAVLEHGSGEADRKRRKSRLPCLLDREHNAGTEKPGVFRASSGGWEVLATEKEDNEKERSNHSPEGSRNQGWCCCPAKCSFTSK